MKLIKENFDTIIARKRKIAEYLEKKEKSYGKKDSVKDWYERKYPQDADIVADVDPALTFEKAALLIVPVKDDEDKFYETSIDDSVARERVFEKIAEIYGVSYDDVYDTWMGKSDTKLKDILHSDGIIESLNEDADSEKVYQVTYKASENIFSSFMVKAKDKDEAIDKAVEYRKKKYNTNTDIIGAKEMSASEVKDYTNRGMSLIESVDVDKEDKGRLLIIDYKDGKMDLEKLHKELLDLFSGDVKKAFTFFVENEDVKLKEDCKEPIKEDIEIEVEDSDGDVDSVIVPSDEIEASIESEEKNEKEEEVIPDGPETYQDFDIANSLNALIRDEWEAIEGYNNASNLLKTMKEYDTELKIDVDGIIKILADIANEENLHVGQLQKALEMVSPNAESIKDGAKEAEEQIEETESEPKEDKEEVVEVDATEEEKTNEI